MKYTTKMCPYCRHPYVIHAPGDQIKYGCPLIICSRCGKNFWDTDIKEPALYGFDNEFEKRKRLETNLAMVMYGGIGLVILIASIITEYYFMIIFGILIAGFDFFLISKELERRAQNKKNHDLIIKEQQKQYDESFKRLQNMNYLRGLADVDFRAEFVLKEIESGEKDPFFADRPE